jgi:predicted ester cyclase
MKSNIEIIQDLIEQIVNQKQIERWDDFFSPDYVAHCAPFIGMGFARDTSGKKHIVSMVFPNSPAEGKLQADDELLWLEDEDRRWVTFEEIEQGLRGSKYTLGVRRVEQMLEIELAKTLIKGLDTHTEQAKSEMQAFMRDDFPDLQADIKLILADGDMVVSLMEYRGTHAKFKREAVWREAWFVRISGGHVVESWPILDESSFLRHLGYQLLPPSA